MYVRIRFSIGRFVNFANFSFAFVVSTGIYYLYVYTHLNVVVLSLVLVRRLHSLRRQDFVVVNSEHEINISQEQRADVLRVSDGGEKRHDTQVQTMPHPTLTLSTTCVAWGGGRSDGFVSFCAARLLLVRAASTVPTLQLHPKHVLVCGWIRACFCWCGCVCGLSP